PNPHGPIHLHNVQVIMEPPDTVTVQINGYDERPWPDAWFWLQYRDLIGIASQDVALDTKTRRSDSPWQDIWGGIELFFAAILAFVPGLGYWPAQLFVGLMELARSSNHVPAEAGVARRVLENRPRSIPVPLSATPGADRPQSLWFYYLTRRVADDAIY